MERESRQEWVAAAEESACSSFLSFSQRCVLPARSLSVSFCILLLVPNREVARDALRASVQQQGATDSSRPNDRVLWWASVAPKFRLACFFSLFDPGKSLENFDPSWPCSPPHAREGEAASRFMNTHRRSADDHGGCTVGRDGASRAQRGAGSERGLHCWLKKKKRRDQENLLFGGVFL